MKCNTLCRLAWKVLLRLCALYSGSCNTCFTLRPVKSTSNSTQKSTSNYNSKYRTNIWKMFVSLAKHSKTPLIGSIFTSVSLTEGIETQYCYIDTLRMTTNILITFWEQLRSATNTFASIAFYILVSWDGVMKDA